MKTLVIANQKGGVGKSTLTVHLAYAAKDAGKKVLLVDMDKQGSLSLSFPQAKDAKPGLVASKLFDDIENSEQPEAIDEQISILRADNGLLAIDKADNNVISRPSRVLRRFQDVFDVCFIDTPPALGVRLMASLAASNYIITPVSVGLFELAGVADLMKTINVVKSQGINPRLKHIGFIIMKMNSRSKEERTGLENLRASYRNAILADTLPERAAVRKAIALRNPVWAHVSGESHVKAAKEWRAACNSIITKMV